MYGESESELRFISPATLELNAQGFTATDILVTTISGEPDFQRIDVELSVQHRLNETFALVGGIRYERLKSEGLYNGTTTSSTNILNLLRILTGEPDLDLGLQSVEQDIEIDSKDETYSIRGGAAAFVPITGSVLGYVNGLLHVSHSPAATFSRRVTDPTNGSVTEGTDRAASSETSVGPDLAVGALFRFSDNVALDVRYRGIFYFPVAGDLSFDDPRVNHGLNVGLTFSF
jgi:opacity protein-like surface antigen